MTIFRARLQSAGLSLEPVIIPIRGNYVSKNLKRMAGDLRCTCWAGTCANPRQKTERQKDAAMVTPRPHGLTTCNNRRRRCRPTNTIKKKEIICLRLHLNGRNGRGSGGVHLYINEGGAGMWAGFSKGATMAKWKRKRRNAIKWRSAQNLQKHKRTHLHTNTGKYRQQMDTHATWAEQAGSEVGGRVSGVRQQRTQDTGHWQLATHAKILPVGRRAPGTGSRDPRSPGPLLPILLQTILGTVAPSKPAGFSSNSIR